MERIKIINASHSVERCMAIEGEIGNFLPIEPVGAAEAVP